MADEDERVAAEATDGQPEGAEPEVDAFEQANRALIQAYIAAELRVQAAMALRERVKGALEVYGGDSVAVAKALVAEQVEKERTERAELIAQAEQIAATEEPPPKEPEEPEKLDEREGAEEPEPDAAPIHEKDEGEPRARGGRGCGRRRGGGQARGGRRAGCG